MIKLNNYSKFYLLVISMLFAQSLISQSEIVYLISNPRASMVEFLRMIGERKDFKVMHIPANFAYCHAHNYLDLVQGWYREDAPSTYQQAKEDILKESQKANVFVGENTHTAKEFLEFNQNFVSDPKVKFIFLISNPHTAIISYYDKKKEYFDKMPISQISESIGLEYLYYLSKKLEDLDKKPLIVKSEDLYYNTSDTVEDICNYLDIPFKAESLHWKDLSQKFSKFEDWYTIELTDCAKNWHMQAISSTKFTKPKEYLVNSEGLPTFEEIENRNHRDICIKAYLDNLKYYNLLVKN